MEANQVETAHPSPAGSLFRCLAGGLIFAAVVAFLPYGAIGSAIAAFFAWGPVGSVAVAVESAVAWLATWAMMDLRITWFVLIAAFCSVTCIDEKIDLQGVWWDHAHTVALIVIFVGIFVVFAASVVSLARPSQLEELAKPGAVLQDRGFISRPAIATVSGCRKYTAQYANTPALVEKFQMLVNDVPLSSTSCQAGKLHALLLRPREQ